MDGKQRRIAKYKEEKRKQLASHQFGSSAAGPIGILSSTTSSKYTENCSQQNSHNSYQSARSAGITSSVSATVEKQQQVRVVAVPVITTTAATAATTSSKGNIFDN